jgi:ankyrin repeat protein
LNVFPPFLDEDILRDVKHWSKIARVFYNFIRSPMYALRNALLVTLLFSSFVGVAEVRAQGASFEGVQNRPLISAIDKGNLAEVEALLRTAIDPNDFAGTHFAAIHAAAAKGNVRIVQALLASGVDVNLADNHLQRQTPLFYAIDWGLLHMVKFLIDKGANVNARTWHGYSPLHMAAGSHENSLQMVRLLVKHGADINAAAMNQTTVLESAVQSDNPKVLEFLLKSGANPEAITYFGATIINDAVLGEREDTVKVLLRHRVSLTHRNSPDGFAPIHHAAYTGNMRIAKMLLAAGADPSFPTTNGKLAEEVAEERENRELAEYLKQARRTK